MKKILAITLFLLLTISLYGQTDIRDYFYPQLTPIVLESPRENKYDDYFVKDIAYGGQSGDNILVTYNIWRRISGDKLMGEEYEKIRIERDRIVSFEQQVVSRLSNETRHLHNDEILLKLPPENGIAHWKIINQNDKDFEDRFTARFVIINVEINNIRKDIQAIRVDNQTYQKGNKFTPKPRVSYWVKGYGNIINNIVEGYPMSGYYSTIITNRNFREVPYYDIEAEERARIEQERLEQEKIEREKEIAEQEKQERLDTFLAKTYTEAEISSNDNQKRFENNRNMILLNIEKIIQSYEITDLELNICDSVYVKSDGSTEHTIHIDVPSGQLSNYIIDKISNAVSSLKFAPMKAEEPHSQIMYDVSSVYEYSINIKTYNLDISKRGASGKLVNGNTAVWEANKNYIISQLAENGKYSITYEEITTDDKKELYVFEELERMPSFQGGDIKSFRSWTQSKVRYPEIASMNGISGCVKVSFVIDKNGSLTDIEVMQAPDRSLSDEVIRVLRESPRWTPCILRGQNTDFKYTISIDFYIR